MKLIKKINSVILFLLISAFYTFSQDCTIYFPSNVGAVRELTQLDAKKKLSGIVKQTVTSNERIANGVKISFDNETLDKNGKLLFKGNYNVKCENGVYNIDMNSFLSGQTMSAYKDMDVQLTSDNLVFPQNLSVGQNLSGGTLTMVIKNNGFQIMKMTTVVSNRKVEAIESISTSAGTFECYKISYTVVTDMLFKVETKGIEWIAKKVGAVKTEIYDKKGKLIGSSELTAYKE